MIKTVAIIAITVSVLLSVFLLTVKTKTKLSNRLLALFIIICTMDISGVFINKFTDIFLISKAFLFVVFPVIYMYVLSICYADFKLKTKHVWHLLPFIVYGIMLTGFLVYSHDSWITIAFRKAEWVFHTLFLKIQAIVYLTLSLLVLTKHKKLFLENYANGDISAYNWLFKVLLTFAISLPITVLKDFMAFNGAQQLLNLTTFILVSIALIMFSWFVFKALYNPDLFRGIDPALQNAEKTQSKKANKQDKKSDIPSEKINSQIDGLKKHMETKEPFLNPSLTLQDLASELNLSARELSVLINKQLGQHFFDFVNQYRIRKAQQLIEDSGKNNLTFQQILYDVGFNSKSSFNTAFKKHTGETPTGYRKRFS